MHPILVKFGPFTVYSYGVMVAVGFALAIMLLYARAAKFNIDKNKAVDLAMVILISGIIGARLLYVLLNPLFFIANPLEIIMLSKGGLVWYGGFALALVISMVYLGKTGLDFWLAADLIAPYLALAQGFGRIGCFLNGCCYGIKFPAGSALAWTSFGSDPRFPSQLISAGILFLIFAILLIWQNRRRFAGEILLGYCILYSGKRFVVEFSRGDNPKILAGLTMAQLISAGLFAAALILFILRKRRWRKIRTISK
ncbi:MAG: prolipoprotein diacylglyceryl transferase [Candidatus Omnitrophota bacterium]|nr:prolipoprotein diacylglyceryl transferase [Candidatus Omnitrophota bacterium]